MNYRRNKIRRISLIAITLLIASATVYAGANAVSRFWQDSIPKPTMEWKVIYGNGDFSQVAFNIDRLLRSNNNHAQVIVQLNKRLLELEKVDEVDKVDEVNEPNEVKE